MKTDIKVIKSKNYITYAIICILTIILVFYLSMWYETRQEYYQNNSIMAELLATVNKQELPNYTLENPNSIIYIASSKDNQIKLFEKHLKKFVLDEELNNQMVYLDTAQIYNDNLATEINNLIVENKKIDNIEISKGINFIVFENGKVKAILHKNSENAKIEHVKNFFAVYRIID
ncbi:MAG: DUF6568 family protein [Bacilli bacterium]